MSNDSTTAVMPGVGTHVLVTLKDPILVVLGETPTMIIAVEGEIAAINGLAIVARAYRLLREAWSENQKVHPFVTMRGTVTMPLRNIRGLVTIPTKKP